MKEYKELIISLIGFVLASYSLATILGNPEIDIRLLRVITLIAYAVFAGGIIWFALNKQTTFSQSWRLISLGFLYIATIPFFLWVGSWLNGPMNPCQAYGIAIIKPSSDYLVVNGQATIQGTFTKRPPAKTIQLIGVGGTQFWPQNINNIEMTETGWTGKSFGEDGYRVLVAYVGENGRSLFDYFQKAGDESGKFPGIDQLPDDVVECDSVFIPAP